MRGVKLSSRRDLETASKTFAALSSPVRLSILLILSEAKRPLHIKAVSKQLGIDYAACYRHVENLKRAKIIKIYDVGRSRVLAIANPEKVKEMMSIGASLSSKSRDA